MKLSPTIKVDFLFSKDEIDVVVETIHKFSRTWEEFDLNGKLRAVNHDWDYYDSKNSKIRELLDTKFRTVFKKDLLVADSHILDSKSPYLLHTDYVHTSIPNTVPEYTVIIPLDDYDSNTIIFNEYAEETNELEKYKQKITTLPTLKIDKILCADRLSHIHPNDLKYLSLKEMLPWNKGSMYAVDRRYFHCSDNFLKRGISNKLAIILWTVKEIN